MVLAAATNPVTFHPNLAIQPSFFCSRPFLALILPHKHPHARMHQCANKHKHIKHTNIATCQHYRTHQCQHAYAPTHQCATTMHNPLTPRCTNAPTNQHANTPAHQHTSTPAHQHTSTPTCRQTNVPTCQHAKCAHTGMAADLSLPFSTFCI